MQSQKILQKGRYRILNELGRGGMGIVYQGRDQNLQGQFVAIKENLDCSLDSQRQFEREAIILAQLKHFNLPRVTDYFIEQPSGRQYLIMDYVSGVDLKDIVRQLGPLPEGDVLMWTAQVMDALTYLHQRVDLVTNQPAAVIHRDIKPSNIRRMRGDQIKLVDFGIAKVGNAATTWVGARSITRGYSPIEQYGHDTDTRSDIYSLGATLYYLLTGVDPPDAGKEIPSIRRLNSAVTPHTARVILRAMQERADERYQSIEEMRMALFEPSWWERINLPRIAKGVPIIGDVQTSGATGPRSTKNHSREIEQRPKINSTTRPRTTSAHNRRRFGFLAPALIFLLSIFILITTVWILMHAAPPPEPPASTVTSPPCTDRSNYRTPYGET